MINSIIGFITSNIYVVILLIPVIFFPRAYLLYRLTRSNAIRIRVIRPDGRSDGVLTQITQNNDIQYEGKSFLYDASCITYEGQLKVPTLEYLLPSRRPIRRRRVVANDPNAKDSPLSPEAAYDGIRSHIARQLVYAFTDFLTPQLTLIITIAAIVIVGLAVYAGVRFDLERQLAIIISTIQTTDLTFQEIGR